MDSRHYTEIPTTCGEEEVHEYRESNSIMVLKVEHIRENSLFSFLNMRVEGCALRPLPTTSAEDCLWSMTILKK